MAVIGEAVDALALGNPLVDVLRLGRIGDVIDVEAGLEAVFGLARIADGFVIGEHDAVLDAHLVGMDAAVGAHHRFQNLGAGRVFDVDDCGRFRAFRMAHIGNAVRHLDLAAALAVHIRNLAQSIYFRHTLSPFLSHWI
jgi:hypothetical protein